MKLKQMIKLFIFLSFFSISFADEEVIDVVDPTSIVLLAKNHEKSKNYEEAAVAYERYLVLTDFKDKELIFKTANFYTKAFLYEKAFNIFNKDEKLFKNLLGGAIIGRTIGNYDISKKKYLLALSREPNNKEVILGLAIVYQMLKDFEQSKRYFEQYLEKNKDEDVYITLVNIYMYEENFTKAKELSQEGLKHFASDSLKQILVEIYNKEENKKEK